MKTVTENDFMNHCTVIDAQLLLVSFAVCLFLCAQCRDTNFVFGIQT